MPSSHRLLVTPADWARLREPPADRMLKRVGDVLGRLCERWSSDRTVTVDETGHNYHLIRAREVQTRVVSLLVQYGRTGARPFRDAALDYVRDMAAWEYWSWIKWREKVSDPDAIFDLSYGENAMTLALVQDWLADSLTETEQALILDTARRRALGPYLARNGEAGKEMWYYRKPDCNWNTVCNGGAGLLALALRGLYPESERVLALVEEGIRHYFEFLAEDGAWPEGIGYWGYGHRYGFYYLLSREAVDGRPHPLLERPGSRATLRFPLLFSPNGVPSGFGDANGFSPLPFHLAAACRYGMNDVVCELNRRFDRLVRKEPDALNRTGPWPGLAELLLFRSGPLTEGHAAPDWPLVSLQRGLEWGYLADHWPAPRLYASVRGGTTRAPHTHQDLTSLTVVVGGEALIVNVSPSDYIDTTFSDRRFEIYEMNAASKNVLLVNGVGYPHPGEVQSRRVSGPEWEGILLDGAAAQKPGTTVHACGRIVLLLARRALLVIDRVSLEHAGLTETRWHTAGRLMVGARVAQVRGRKEVLRLAFAASVPAVLRQALGPLTDPKRKPLRVVRWLAEAKHADVVMATLLTPGLRGRLSLDPHTRRLHARGNGFDVTLRYPAQGLGIEAAPSVL